MEEEVVQSSWWAMAEVCVGIRKELIADLF